MRNRHLHEDYINTLTPFEIKFIDQSRLKIDDIMFSFGDPYLRNRFLLNIETQAHRGTLKPKTSNHTVDDFNGHTIIDTGMNIIETMPQTDVQNGRFLTKVQQLLRKNACFLANKISEDTIKLKFKNNYTEIQPYNEIKTEHFNKTAFITELDKLVYVATDRWEWVPLDCYYKGFKDEKDRVIISEQYYSHYLY